MLVRASIEARAVTQRTRAGRVSIRDISLTVGQSELVAIIGTSGSGKATLLDALSGRYPPTSGTVARHPGGPAGYVPAGGSLPPVLPLARALRYGAVLRGIRDPARAVGEALVVVGLTAEAGIPVGTLNPGERKRAEIAAELLAGPAALFLDEPATALDPAQAAQVLRLLRSLSGTGITVLFTTSSSFDAARCDKVAVLATGGHLAFFGTPAAALGYFGADSLEEIYERLSGLGDPAAAWSRRFFYFSAAASGSTAVPTTPRAPGPPSLIPDQAGPHSAGRPSPPFPGDQRPGDRDGPGFEPRGGLDRDPGLDRDREPGRAPRRGHERVTDRGRGHDLAAVPGRGLDREQEHDRDPGDRSAQVPGSPRGPGGEHGAVSGSPRPPGPARQLPVLIMRNAEILARARRQQAVMAAAPLAVLLVLWLLLGVGALDGAAPVTLAWTVLGGLVAGLAYELPVRASEAGVLRRERFTGLSVPAFLAAKAALLVPALAVADVIILAVPATAARLQAGFAMSYLTVFISSLVGLAALFPGIARRASA